MIPDRGVEVSHLDLAIYVLIIGALIEVLLHVFKSNRGDPIGRKNKR